MFAKVEATYENVKRRLCCLLPCIILCLLVIEVQYLFVFGRFQEPPERRCLHAAELRGPGHHARHRPAERADPPAPGAAGAQRQFSRLQLARLQRLAGLQALTPAAPQRLGHIVQRQQRPRRRRGRRWHHFTQTRESGVESIVVSFSFLGVMWKF